MREAWMSLYCTKRKRCLHCERVKYNNQAKMVRGLQHLGPGMHILDLAGTYPDHKQMCQNCFLQ